ncbi:unnamed protein product, partial [Brassica rapa subsp. narinosa]
MDERKIKLHVMLLSFILISIAPSIHGFKMRGITRSEPEAFHGGKYFPAMKSRKLMATKLEVDYSGDYDDAMEPLQHHHHHQCLIMMMISIKGKVMSQAPVLA